MIAHGLPVSSSYIYSSIHGDKRADTALLTEPLEVPKDETSALADLGTLLWTLHMVLMFAVENRVVT